jgi:hypothetical protein
VLAVGSTYDRLLVHGSSQVIAINGDSPAGFLYFCGFFNLEITPSVLHIFTWPFADCHIAVPWAEIAHSRSTSCFEWIRSGNLHPDQEDTESTFRI